MHVFGTLRRTLVPWQPKILTEFEIGLACAAADDVARLDKPIAEVGTRIGSRDDIEHDLRHCVARRASHEQVSIWIRRRGEHWAFGFYVAQWTQRALDYLEQTDLAPSDRHWISGLLFGYRATAIQAFTDSVAAPESAASRSPSRSAGTDIRGAARRILGPTSDPGTGRQRPSPHLDTYALGT